MGPIATQELSIRSSDSFYFDGIAEECIVVGLTDTDDQNSSQSFSSDGDVSSDGDAFVPYFRQEECRGSGHRSKENLRPARESVASRYDEGGPGAIGLGSGASDDSYRRRRQRNNAAVKRSRDKARQRQRESQRRLAELSAENRRLQMKADVLAKELSLLRGLFPAVEAGGAAHPLLQEVDGVLGVVP